MRTNGSGLLLALLRSVAGKNDHGPRATLQPQARTLLAEADERLQAQDHAGALRAYIEAVNADPAAAKLETIRRYAPRPFSVVPPPPPLPPHLADAIMKDRAEERAEEAAAHLAALRQFLELHPGDLDAVRDLVLALPDDEAAPFADALLRKRPRDARLHHVRAQLRFRTGQLLQGLADLDRAATLDSDDAELFYTTGVALHVLAANAGELSTELKREVIRRGIAALERAESLRTGHGESFVYRSLLLDQQAELESDPVIQNQLTEQANAARRRAMAIVLARARANRATRGQHGASPD